MDEKVAQVGAGSVHTAILTQRGEVFTCGKCEYNGHGEREDILVPKLLEGYFGGSNVTVKSISVGPGGYHTIALTNKGEVYTWGHNRVGQVCLLFYH
jgi:alpha-tubulin suppressor-like RCC1 family protein